jgi:hypothetical protein
VLDKALALISALFRHLLLARTILPRMQTAPMEYHEEMEVRIHVPEGKT